MPQSESAHSTEHTAHSTLQTACHTHAHATRHGQGQGLNTVWWDELAAHRKPQAIGPTQPGRRAAPAKEQTRSLRHQQRHRSYAKHRGTGPRWRAATQRRGAATRPLQGAHLRGTHHKRGTMQQRALAPPPPRWRPARASGQERRAGAAARAAHASACEGVRELVGRQRSRAGSGRGCCGRHRPPGLYRLYRESLIVTGHYLHDHTGPEAQGQQPNHGSACLFSIRAPQNLTAESLLSAPASAPSHCANRPERNSLPVC